MIDAVWLDNSIRQISNESLSSDIDWPALISTSCRHAGTCHRVTNHERSSAGALEPLPVGRRCHVRMRAIEELRAEAQATPIDLVLALVFAYKTVSVVRLQVPLQFG